MIILRNKNYSQEDEIAKIDAVPGSPEYSHERAEIEKTPSKEAAAMQEEYEKSELDIKKSGATEELEGEGHEVVANEVRQEREGNLDKRNDALKTLNDFLNNI